MVLFEPLQTIQPSEQNILQHPAKLPELVHIDDPALHVLLDFNHIKPLTIDSNATIDAAQEEMRVTGLHHLLVIDSKNRVVGLISSEDILGEKPIKLQQERKLARSEVKVKLIMTPIAKLTAIDFHSLKYAKVGNIINTLQKLREHYLLVVRPEHDKQVICGLFSAWRLSEQLHTDITAVLTEAKSLAELQRRHSK